jgi:hypothetical protein
MRRIPHFDAGTRRFDPDLVDGFLAARRVQNHVIRIVALLVIATTCSIAYWVLAKPAPVTGARLQLRGECFACGVAFGVGRANGLVRRHKSARSGHAFCAGSRLRPRDGRTWEAVGR